MEIDAIDIQYNDSNDTFELRFNNKELQTYLSSLPQDKRTWNKESCCWVILPDALSLVVSYARHFFNFVDSSSLPVRYQKIVNRAMAGDTNDHDTRPESNHRAPPKGGSEYPYSMFYVLESAPDNVIKAIYKTLVSEHHPDHGGNVDKFHEVMKAYEAVKSLRGW